MQAPVPVPRPASLIGLLADEHRRLVFAAIVLGNRWPSSIAEVTGLEPRHVVRSIERLLKGAILVVDGAEGLSVNTSALEAGARTEGPDRQTSTEMVGVDHKTDHKTGAIISAFFENGRLRSYPAQLAKQKVVLDVLAQRFEPGRVYSEAAVNLELGQVYADTALLRRSMVDLGFMERRDRFYWRSGGTFEPDS